MERYTGSHDTIAPPATAIVPHAVKAAPEGCQASHDDLNTRDYLMENVLHSLSAPVFVLDMDGRFILANHAALAIGGWDFEDVFCKRFTSLMTKSAAKRMKALFAQTAFHGVSIFDQEVEIVLKDGTERLMRFSISPVRVNGDIMAVSGTVYDVTELRALEDSLRASTDRYRELSIRDHLTGLYNLRHFFTEVETEIARARRYARPLSLIFMDIDDFKHFNDTWGHVEGDKVLKVLGYVIRDTIRTADLAFRYGGEEFTVLLPETEVSEGIAIADRLRRAFSQQTFHPAGAEEPVVKTLSLGVTQLRDEESFKTFVSRADHNMYHAKGLGKNRVETDNAPS